MRRFRSLVILLILVAAFICTQPGAVFFAGVTARAEAQVKYPAYRGYSNDFAGVISSNEESQIDSILGELERKTGVQGAIVTVETVAPLDSKGYAVGLFQDWGIGKKDQDNGFLVLLAMKERRVEIEVGYGLEPVLTDAICGQILDREVVPYLKNGEYGKGMLGAARALSARILEANGETGGETPGGTNSQTAGDSGEGGSGTEGPDLDFMIALILFIMIWIIARSRSKRSSSSSRKPPTRRGGGPFLPPPGGLGRSGRPGGFGGSSRGGFGGFGGGRSGGGGAGRGF